jgi:chemotaxis protein CheC
LNADQKASLTLQERQLDALREVANIGAGHAATALSQMTGSRIDVSVPFLQVAPLEQVPETLGDRNATIAVVLIHVLGDLTGRTLLVLPLECARRLAGILLNRKTGEVTEFGEMERSALMEAGNILSAAHMNALSDFLGLMLLPSVPQLELDQVEAVVSRLLTSQARVGEYAFSIETRFSIRGTEPVTGQFLYLPSFASLRIVFDALRIG